MYFLCVRGSAISKIIGENVKANTGLFEEIVKVWVYEEEVNIPKESKHYNASSPACQGPQKLTYLVNEYHENFKYLPGVTLPSNVVATSSLEESIEGSTILIFVMPHQFIKKTCQALRNRILPYARGVSCIKGLEVSENGIQLISEVIGKELNIYCGALSGANIASEIAEEKYSETTVAYDPPPLDSRQPTPEASPKSSQVNLVETHTEPKERSTSLKALPAEYPPLNHANIKKLFHRPYFHVRMVSDVAGVSLGGALKNIVALAAGWVDGLGWGNNAKAAIMRVGILEEVKFGQKFFAKSVHAKTFTEESCGVADMITSCSGGRNFKCARLSIERGVSVEEVEKTELNGQKLQGTLTANELNAFLNSQNMEDEFPLFTTVHSMITRQEKTFIIY